VKTLNIIYDDRPHDRFPGHSQLRRVRDAFMHPKDVRWSGMRLVVENLRIGLDELQVPYTFCTESSRHRLQGATISFGLGRDGVKGLPRDVPLIAAIGFPYPTEFPELERDFNLRFFLQHSEWALNFVAHAGVYSPAKLALWRAGINQSYWHPDPSVEKSVDVLVYWKMHWEKRAMEYQLLGPLLRYLHDRGASFRLIEYGKYTVSSYRELLRASRALVFVSPHESQGFAYQEAMACDVPVFAWNPGFWFDPDRARYGLDFVPTSSVPFFDDSCGDQFCDLAEFKAKWPRFWRSVQRKEFAPLSFVSANLSIRRSTEEMLQLVSAL
jgi:hypothetical protein